MRKIRLNRARKERVTVCPHCLKRIFNDEPYVVFVRPHEVVHERCATAYKTSRPWLVRSPPLPKARTFVLLYGFGFALALLSEKFWQTGSFGTAALLVVVLLMGPTLQKIISWLTVERKLCRRD